MNLLFISFITLTLLILYGWGFRTLQKEKWQIIGSVPTIKHAEDVWLGTNLTYYGFFQAVANMFAVAMVIILFGAMVMPITDAVVITAVFLGVCIPAAKLIAKVVEKKAYTFSVGGASFVGIIFGPWLIVIMKRVIGIQSDPVAVLAALAIAYAFGESIGRLACISFGCCYGKPISQLPSIVQKLFSKYAFIFTGKTKKIAYADGLDSVAVFPIQAITSVIYGLTGLVGIYLFLHGLFMATFLEAILVTQIWRFLSEFLRADYRGGGSITVYQAMSLVAAAYSIVIAWVLPLPMAQPLDIVNGLKVLWNPGIIFFLEILWIGVFLYTGRSQVTEGVLTFNVRKERI